MNKMELIRQLESLRNESEYMLSGDDDKENSVFKRDYDALQETIRFIVKNYPEEEQQND